MSMRVKIALVIMSIVCVITAAGFMLNLSLTRQRVIEAIEQDLSLARDIANDLVAMKTRLLKADAATVAERLLKAGSNEEMTAIMVSQLNEFPEFVSLTVYDRHEIAVNGGESVYTDDMHTDYIDMALAGGTVISTTHYNGAGSFIMHVFVPMGPGTVLSATFSGMIFADLLARYKLWETGNIFMLDETGTIISHYRPELVLDRRNFIAEAKTNPDLAAAGAFFQSIIATEEGVGAYFFEAKERFCSYKRVSGSRAGWRIIVTIALSESPEAGLQEGLLLSSLLFMAVGALISVFASGFVARPFYKIADQNRSLEELNKTVRAASEAKSKFLANMSHEMRTPLNAIIGLSELSLESGEAKKENQQDLEKIYNAGTTLLSTVNDILDISKIEAGKFELVAAEYDIPSLINDAVTQSVLHIGEKPIQFILDIDGDLPTRLYGDELRIKQIFNNLLSNAFKYTREGTVELGIRCSREGDAVWMTACVRDTGIGIRPGDVDRLFFDFIQMDMESNRKIEGTGLGLSIAKRIAEMMDGSITVESEYGRGSVFTVKLRQQFVADAVIGPEVVKSLKNFHYSDQKRHKNSRLARIRLPYARVLVVDDVPTNLDVAKGMLKPYGMQVDCVTSGQQAVDAVRAATIRYNAVFMDHMMPEMDGVEATRIIREEIGTEYARDIPIIALTANAIAGNEEMFLRSGFQAFLPKPIEIIRLDAIIRQWVRDQDAENGLADESDVTEQEETSPWSFPCQVDGVDLYKGLERFDNDGPSYLHILRSYTVNTRPLLDAAGKLDPEDLTHYGVIVHGIKGSSWGIGADLVGNKAEALEKAAREGDCGFVLANNAAFIAAAEKLIADLEAMLRQASCTGKPKRDKPDREMLHKLRTACLGYDMDGVDAAMAELESCEYESDDELVVWLRENVDRVNFAQIGERLSDLPEQCKEAAG